MNTYNTEKMRGCASDITAQLKIYNDAKASMDQLITDLSNNWKDDTNTSLSTKYRNEAKVSAENVAALMNQFVQLLESSAAAFERVQNQARNDIR